MSSFGLIEENMELSHIHLAVQPGVDLGNFTRDEDQCLAFSNN